MSELYISRVKKSDLESLMENYQKNGLNQPLLGMGQSIYNVLFGGVAVELPIELYFDPNHHLREFCFPYELIANPAGGQLCLTDKGSLIRRLEMQSNQELATIPFDALIVTASPKDYPPINADREIGKICEALGAYYDRLARFTVIKGPNTRDQIQDAVTSRQYRIVHLIGHGTDDIGGTGGAVLLEDDRGESEPIDGSRLGAILRSGNRLPSLVILNSCLTAGGRNPPPGWFSNVAWHLLVTGIPAVVAMQAKVQTGLAARAGAEFYKRLFSPGPLHECVGSMRLSLGAQWYAPILAVHSQFDPHFFTKESRQRLKGLHEMNREVERLYNNHDLENMVNYLQSLDPNDRILVHKRRKIAGMIILDVADRLEIPV